MQASLAICNYTAARSHLCTTESPVPGHRCRSSKSNEPWTRCTATTRRLPPHFESRAGCPRSGSCRFAFAWPTTSSGSARCATPWSIVVPGTAARCCPCISEFRPCAAGPARTCYTTTHCHRCTRRTRCCSRNSGSCSRPRGSITAGESEHSPHHRTRSCFDFQSGTFYTLFVIIIFWPVRQRWRQWRQWRQWRRLRQGLSAP